MLLPKDVGPFTLIRKIGTGAVAESYLGRLHGEGDREVVVRRVLPYILRDPPRLASTEARVRDLLGVRHPFLVPVLDWVEDGDERFIVEDRVTGVDLDRVLAWCRSQGVSLPHNVFLNIATQVCNGLEALHGRPGKGSGTDNVLHLGLRPGAILVTREGKVVLGGYGLTRSPTTLSHGGMSSPVPSRMEYLSPEQTQPDKKLTPASDVFSLGALLYELLTLEPLFRSESNLQTINRIRKAEVTTQLLRVKDLMPGLDKVLYRALSLNPRHRYQRAFVLREDLRGLMAGYSFNTIVDDTRAFFAPLLGEESGTTEDAGPAVEADQVHDEAPPPPPQEVAPAVDPAGEPSPEELAEAGIGSGTPDLSTPTSGAAVALGAGVASHVAATLAGPPAEAPPPPLVDHGFDDEIATRVGPPPASTAAMAAEAVREQLAREQQVESLFDEVSHEVERPGEETDVGERLQDRHTLPLPPSSVRDEERTDHAIGLAAMIGGAAAAGLDPNSTRGFLRSDPLPEPPAPSREFSDPASSGIGDLAPARPLPAGPPTVPGLAAPPTVPPAVPPAQEIAAAAPPAPAAPRPDVSDRSARLAAAAPPPGAHHVAVHQAVAPAPPAHARAATVSAPVAAAAHPAPTPVHPVPAPVAPVTAPPDDDGDDLPPPKRGGNGVVIGVAVAMVALVLVCGAGGLALHRMRSAATDAWTAGLEAATTAEAEAPAADPTAGLEGLEPPVVEAVEPDPPAPEPVAAPPEPEPEPEPVAVSRAPDPPPAPAVAQAARTSPTPQATARTSDTRASTARSSSAGSDQRSSSSSTSSRGRAAPVVDEPVADVDPAAPAEPTGATDIERYASPAAKGSLTASDVMALETVQVEDGSYTRSRALLLMNAQRKGDDAATKRYLDQLMLLPENQYNPIYLSDLGRYHVNRKQYETALEKATLAERYWARLPPELVFSKKAEIYETQAAAWQGRFYKSGSDLELLEQAIRHWQKYRDHVETRSRSDLARKAEAELAKLEDIKRRLQ